MFQNCCEDKCKYKVIFNVVLLESNALSWKSLQNFWERYSLLKLSIRFGKNFVPKKIVQNQQFKFRGMISWREMIDLRLFLITVNLPCVAARLLLPRNSHGGRLFLWEKYSLAILAAYKYPLSLLNWQRKTRHTKYDWILTAVMWFTRWPTKRAQKTIHGRFISLLRDPLRVLCNEIMKIFRIFTSARVPH